VQALHLALLPIFISACNGDKAAVDGNVSDGGSTATDTGETTGDGGDTAVDAGDGGDSGGSGDGGADSGGGGGDDGGDTGKDDDCDGKGVPCSLEGGKSLSEADARLIGEFTAEAGYSQGALGDVDADGIDDLYVGGPAISGGPGVVYIVTSAPSGDFDLGGAEARLEGLFDTDFFGVSASGLGDIDGDGHGDLLVGALRDSSGGTQSGAAYLFHGPFSGTADGEDAAVRWMGAEGDWLGYSVTGVGDFTGDGQRDVLVGAPLAGDDPYGVAYLFDSTDFGVRSASRAHASFAGVTDNQQLGSSLFEGGDFNGDGIEDLLVGSYAADYWRGTIWVYDGPVAGAYLTTDGDGAIYGGENGDNAGLGVAVDDLDGDGRDDVLVGSPLSDESTRDAGAVSLIVGPINTARILTSPDAKIVGEAADEGNYGTSLALADLDVDGELDLVVGAPGVAVYGQYDGAAYLHMGPFDADGSTSAADSRWAADLPGQIAGWQVDVAGDINDDGAPDVLVGAPFSSTPGAMAGGVAYLMYCSAI
jgi:FG-GAP repeat